MNAIVYWLADTGAPYPRILYQLHKASDALLIGLPLAVVLGRWHLAPWSVVLAVAVLYWSADYWPSSVTIRGWLTSHHLELLAGDRDPAHASDHPIRHAAAKLTVGLLAPALVVAPTHPGWLAAWVPVYAAMLWRCW